MTSVIADAYVRLRPDVTGFQADAEAQVRGALSGVQKLVIGALGVASVAEGIKSVADAAVNFQQAVALTQKTVENAGASWTVYGKTVEQVLDEQAKSTGFSFDDLYQGFNRLETTLKNTPEALKDLGLAEDISRARGLQLTQVTTALSRAAGGSTTSFQRLGIIIPKVTSASDELKSKLADIQAAQTAQTESQAKHYQGTIQLTQAQLDLAKLSPIQLKNLADQTKAQEAAATATDKAASTTQAFAYLQKAFGGDAATFANTAAGSFDKFRQSLEIAEAELGTALLPTLKSAADQAAIYANELGSSSSAQQALASGAGDVGTAIKALLDIVKDLEPELEATQKILSTIGVGPITVAIVAYKGLGIAIGLAQKAVAQFSGSTLLATTATQEQTAAVSDQILVYRAATGWTTELAASEDALAASSEAATASGAELGAAFAGIGAPELIGIAALAGGIYELNQYLDKGSDSLDGLREGYKQLAAAAPNTAASAAAVKNLVDQYTSLAGALRTADAVGGAKAGFGDAATFAKTAADATQDWIAKVDQLANSIGASDPKLKNQIQNIEYIAVATGKIPSSKEIQIILNDKDALGTLNDVKTALSNPLVLHVQTSLSQPGVFGAAAKSGPAPLLDPAGFDKGIASSLAAVTASLKKPVGDLGKSTAETFSQAFVTHIDVSGIATAFQQSLATAQGNLVTQTGGIADAIGSVLDQRLANRTLKAQNEIDALQRQLDAVDQSRTTRNDAEAVTSASATLASLQSAYGTGPLTTAQALEVQQAQQALADAQQDVVDNGKQIQITKLQQAQDTASKLEAVQKTQVSKSLADLGDELDKGKLSYTKYVTDVRSILSKEDVNLKTTGKLLGTAFADGFQDSVTSAFKQAGILAALGPSLLGSAPRGTAPTNPTKDEATAIQGVIDQIAQSGGRFTLDNVGKLPKGVNVAGLVSAAESQRKTDAYQTATKANSDKQLQYTQETNDHLKTAIALLKQGSNLHVTVVDSSAKAKTRATAKAVHS